MRNFAGCKAAMMAVLAISWPGQGRGGPNAVAERPAYMLDALTIGATVRLLVLDGIQDPGNVGTMLRTAAALGVDPGHAAVVRREHHRPRVP